MTCLGKRNFSFCGLPCDGSYESGNHGQKTTYLWYDSISYLAMYLGMYVFVVPSTFHFILRQGLAELPRLPLNLWFSHFSILNIWNYRHVPPCWLQHHSCSLSLSPNLSESMHLFISPTYLIGDNLYPFSCNILSLILDLLQTLSCIAGSGLW